MLNDKGFANQSAGHGTKTVGKQGVAPVSNGGKNRKPRMLKTEQRGLGTQGAVGDTVGK